MALEQILYYVTIEVENTQCKGLELTSRLGIKDCKLIDVRRLYEGSIRHLISFPLSEMDKVSGEKLRIHGGSKGSIVLASFETQGCSLCNTLLSKGAFLISGKHLGDYKMVYEFIVPGHEVFKEILSILESLGFRPRVLSLYKHEPKKGVLTEKQENALWLALKMGYFDYPRRVGTKELAKTLGVVPSTFSEILRGGIRRLLEKYFESRTLGIE
ncbi:MAG: helix-turn-helix domain-containing protein [Candidatus Brockarchaeota archaeon]|nr:helix-turn-helix domain-containing protein [Candidatus Brockarchaeota archaeon]